MSEKLNKTILVVDDEQDIRNYLTTALTDAGFDVVTAEDGFQALEIVKEQAVDLVSLDLVMPKRSGAKFYRDLQKEPKLKDIPVLIVTGHARDELGKADFDELTMSGPGVYLEKPVKPTSYVGAICQLLGIEEQAGASQAEMPDLQQQLQDEASKADPEALKRALEALKKNQ